MEAILKSLNECCPLSYDINIQSIVGGGECLNLVGVLFLLLSFCNYIYMVWE